MLAFLNSVVLVTCQKRPSASVTIGFVLANTDWPQQGLCSGVVTLPDTTMGSALCGNLRNCVSKGDPFTFELELAIAHEAQEAELTPTATLMKVLLCSV
jgi:hypothetical protein